MRKEYPTVVESPLYEKLDQRVICNVCERKCSIAEGKRGFCGARKNISGRLYTLTYGDISALESRPIEIKPFFHFYPGSSAMTFSTWGCNFCCRWCQNWRLSRARQELEKANFIPPEKMAEKALERGDQGLCASFQEPTMLLEYSLEAFKIASEKGLYSTYVSNGYMSSEALEMLAKAGMDAINIDIKGTQEVYHSYCGGAKARVVWRNAALAKKLGLHVEIINLIVTTVNDSKKSLDWVIGSHLDHLGQEVPLHFTRYRPAYKFTAPSTKVKTLEKAYELARENGVLYPYIGNVPGHSYENTFCPGCGRLLIERMNFRVVSYRVTEGPRCPSCGESIPIVGTARTTGA